MSKKVSILLWVASFIFMALLAIYQRVTGPTYPVSGKLNYHDKIIKYRFPRTHDSGEDAVINLIVPEQNFIGMLKFRRFKSSDEWSVVQMRRNGDTISAYIPTQPQAGKVIYQVSLVDGQEITYVNQEPTIIRFKGHVPYAVLYPHIFFIFLSMVFSMRTGLEAWFRGSNQSKYIVYTLLFLVLGGMILGPIMQKLAFGAFWTGWPFGHDLTDNKTFIGLFFWLIAFWQLKKNPGNRTWTIVAMFVFIAVFFIPHSVLGSEIDYTKFPTK